MSDTVLRVGFLHLGSPQNGIHRYGRVLAGAMRDIPDVEVVERVVDAETQRFAGLRSLGRALRALARADVTIMQHSRHNLWADGRVRLLQLGSVHLALGGRAIVVLHDVPAPGSAGRIEAWSLRLHLLLARAVVVHGEHERSRLPPWPRRRRVLRIPHFVEVRALPPRADARRRFGIAPEVTVVGMLGWIHPRKNYRAGVEAMASLDPATRLWLLGAPAAGCAPYADELLRLADTLGVRERVELTGYLADEELDARLAAVDVGLCPYTDASASGSLASLVAARLPIVATDLPAFREQANDAGRSLQLVPRPTPEDLAAAVRAARGRATKGHDASEAPSPAVIARRYVEAARRAGCA